MNLINFIYAFLNEKKNILFLKCNIILLFEQNMFMKLFVFEKKYLKAFEVNIIKFKFCSIQIYIYFLHSLIQQEKLVISMKF